jgi:hypothetical protein
LTNYLLVVGVTMVLTLLAVTLVDRFYTQPRIEGNCEACLCDCDCSNVTDSFKCSAQFGKFKTDVPRYDDDAVTRPAGQEREPFPLWHHPMLADDTRNAAYQRALESLITPGRSPLFFSFSCV